MSAKEMLDAEHGIGKECKEIMVKDLAGRFASDRNIFITSFWGLGADDLNKLRTSLRKISSRYTVVKNSIAKRALKASKMEDLLDSIEGGVGIAFGGKDPVNTIKALAVFAKAHDALQIRTGYLDGSVLDKVAIKLSSLLPSRQELITKLVLTINAPITGFVNVLAGTLRSFVYVVKAYKEKLEKDKS